MIREDSPVVSSSSLNHWITRLVRHPWSMRLKRFIRDAGWRLNGSRLQNPPVPPGVRSVLFVCLGNICRSPFAGLIAERRLSERGMTGVRSASAGIHTTQSGRSPKEACTAALPFGVSLDRHRPELLTPVLMQAHDLIVVMESGQLEQLRATYPDAVDRIVLLPLFDDQATGYAQYHIDDPFQRPLAEFEACYRRIDRAVGRLLDEMKASR
jgi:protein-tyrosine phosphatase